MSGNARFHDKLHRANHHTLSTSGLLDSAYDPIASYEYPFRGDFILSGALSALSSIIGGDVYAKNTDVNDLNVRGNAIIAGNTTTKNQFIEGEIKLAGQYFGASCIYANIRSVRPEAFTLTLSYQNGVYIKDNLNAYGYVLANDISANGVFYGRLPTIGGFSPNTWDIASCYSTVRTVSTSWSQSTSWVNANSSNMVVDNLLVTGNLTALGSTTLVNLTTNTSDSLSVVNVGLAVPAIYAEIVTADQPVLSLKQRGTGPILSAFGNNSTFIINNSGWIGIGGDPITQLDIYALSSTVDGGNIKLRGSSNSNKDFGISVKNSDLKISHTPKASNVKTTAVTITSASQLYINTDNIGGSVGAPISQEAKLIVNGRIYLSGEQPAGIYEPYISTVMTNGQYENLYKIDNSKSEGPITRIFNLSGSADTPLSGFCNDNTLFKAPLYYPAYSTRIFPYIGGSLGAGYGAYGGGGVASIDLGYEDTQSTTNLRGLIAFHTLCGSQIDSLANKVERMRITPEGNVGIGTIYNTGGIPNYKLHVLGGSDNDINFMTNGTLGVYNKLDTGKGYGFLSVSPTYTLVGANLRLSGENIDPIYKKGTNSKGSAGVLMENLNGSSNIPKIKFVYSVDTNDDAYTVSESMVISGQRVGINKSVPGTTLHVGGAITLDSETISVEAANSWSSTVNTYNLSGVYMQFAPGTSNNDWAYLRQIGTDNKYHLSLDLHDDRLAAARDSGIGQSFSIRNIGSSGLDPDEITTLFHLNIDSGVPYVGIGTSTPESNLHISSGINSNGHCYLTLESDTDGNNANEDCHPGIIFKQDGGYKTGYLGYFGLNGLGIRDHNQFQVRCGEGIVFSTGGAEFGVNYGYGQTNATYLSANPRMYIQSDGKIGINTLSPQYQLDVNGSLNVSGQLTGTTINDIYTKINSASNSGSTLSTNFNTLSTNFNTLSTNFNTLSTNFNTLSTNFNTLSSNLNTFKVESTSITAPTNGTIANDQYLKISINGVTKYIRLWDTVS
jgi:hypothetical protein